MKTKEQQDMAAAWWISKFRAELDPNQVSDWWVGPDTFTVFSFYFPGYIGMYVIAVKGVYFYQDFRQVVDLWLEHDAPQPIITIHVDRGPRELNAILELEIQEALVYQSARDTEHDQE